MAPEEAAQNCGKATQPKHWSLAPACGTPRTGCIMGAAQDDTGGQTCELGEGGGHQEHVCPPAEGQPLVHFREAQVVADGQPQPSHRAVTCHQLQPHPRNEFA